MNHRLSRGGLLLLAAVLTVFLAGCSKVEQAAYKAPDPFTLEEIKGTELVRLKLEPKAVERTGIKTGKVTGVVQFGAEPTARRIPYAALLYKPDGSTFVYTTTKAGTYQRHDVTVDYIKDQTVVLSDGPEVGTAVVTDGAAELMGIEFGVGK